MKLLIETCDIVRRRKYFSTTSEAAEETVSMCSTASPEGLDQNSSHYFAEIKTAIGL